MPLRPVLPSVAVARVQEADNLESLLAQEGIATDKWCIIAAGNTGLDCQIDQGCEGRHGIFEAVLGHLQQACAALAPGCLTQTIICLQA